MYLLDVGHYQTSGCSHGHPYVVVRVLEQLRAAGRQAGVHVGVLQQGHRQRLHINIDKWMHKNQDSGQEGWG